MCVCGIPALGDQNVAFSAAETKKKTPWPQYASELYQPSDRCL
jgi:hypothetical protein